MFTCELGQHHWLHWLPKKLDQFVSLLLMFGLVRNCMSGTYGGWYAIRATCSLKVMQEVSDPFKQQQQLWLAFPLLYRRAPRLSFTMLCQHWLALSVCDIHSVRLLLSLLSALGCGEPPEVYDSWNMTVLSGTSTGNEITFNCVEGFEISGDPKVVCQPNQEWSKAPICTSEFIVITKT